MQGKDRNTALKRQRLIEQARKLFGYPPKLIVEMCQNVATADGYLRLLLSLRDNGTLTQAEQQTVMLAASSWNGSAYCIAAHRTAARRAGVDQDDLDRVSRLAIPADRRLQALVTATWALLDKEGRLHTEDLAPFDEFGIEKAQIYEIVALVAADLIENYVALIDNVPLDAAIIGQRL